MLLRMPSTAGFHPAGCTDLYLRNRRAEVGDYPTKAKAMLVKIRANIRSAIAEIRTLVYDLRPRPAT
ncbi:MAG: hypothetical protein JWM44_2031 [Bacilli bacterium]|jgi:hypothetical protein|nr:hypothetical protein [Bacilli bacterium]